MCTAATYSSGCPSGFTSINQDDVGVECLKLKVGGWFNVVAVRRWGAGIPWLCT
jgi:hypothetical protein